MRRLINLNGADLDLLGMRERDVFRTTTLARIEQSYARHPAGLGLDLIFHQSNHEGEFVDLIQSARQSADAIIVDSAR